MNMGCVAIFAVGFAVYLAPTYDTEPEPLPILEISDTEEVFLPMAPLTDEEIFQKSLDECDANVKKYGDICAETEANKDCNIWLYHTNRCNRWRNPTPMVVSAPEPEEEIEEPTHAEIAMWFGIPYTSMAVEW
jgi:hypothetical protein